MIALVDPDPAFCAHVAGELGSLPDPVQVLDRAAVQAVGEPGVPRPSVVLLGPGVGDDDALALAVHLQAAAPDVTIVLVSEALTSELLQAA
ncbi:MAG: hypothetical protein ACRDJM_10120, partial [Actinomycetota bacterium]